MAVSNGSKIGLPCILGIIGTLALSLFAGLGGYKLEEFVRVYPGPAISIFILGAAFGWFASGAIEFLRLKYECSSEKKALEDKIFQLEDTVVDQQARISLLEAEQRFCKDVDDLQGQVAAVYVREHNWKKGAK